MGDYSATDALGEIRLALDLPAGITARAIAGAVKRLALTAAHLEARFRDKEADTFHKAAVLVRTRTHLRAAALADLLDTRAAMCGDALAAME